MCALDKEQDVRTSEGGEQKRPLLPMKGGAGDEDNDDDGDDDICIMMKCLSVCVSQKIIT